MCYNIFDYFIFHFLSALQCRHFYCGKNIIKRTTAHIANAVIPPDTAAFSHSFCFLFQFIYVPFYFFFTYPSEYSALSFIFALNSLRCFSVSLSSSYRFPSCFVKIVQITFIATTSFLIYVYS